MDSGYDPVSMVGPSDRLYTPSYCVKSLIVRVMSISLLFMQDKWTRMSSCTQLVGLAPPWLMQEMNHAGPAALAMMKSQEIYCVRAQR